MRFESNNVFAHELLLALPDTSVEQRYNDRDTILYNLGIGFDTAAIEDDSMLPYVLEDGLLSFPTMACVLGVSHDMFLEPRFGIDFARLVHGEEEIEVLAPLPVSGTVRGVSRIEGLWDRGADKGAVMRAARTLFDSNGAKLAVIRSTVILRGNGGFGGTAQGLPHVVPAPARPADGIVVATTRREQALTYRLSGDRNPLHSVPAVARAVGFPGPILHGLCSFGVVARALVATLAGHDATRLKRFGLRFASPVFPGETLRIEYWDLGADNFVFQARVAERDVIVLKGGQVTISASLR